MTVISQKEKEDMDEILRVVDAECIKAGVPVLSVLVTHDDDAPSTAFWDSVEKYNLRKPGESNEELTKRAREECFTAKYPPSMMGEPKPFA